MILPKGSSVDGVGGGPGQNDPQAEDSGVPNSNELGFSGIGGGARSFGKTGEVLSRKNRLQVHVFLGCVRVV